MPIGRRALSLLVAAALCGLLVFSGTHCTGGGGGDGTIEVSGPGVTIEVSGPRTVIVKSGDSVTAPAGTYKAKRIRVVGSENANGRAVPWTVDGKGSLGDLEKIKVRSGKTTTISAGPPFTVRAKTTVKGSGSQKVVDIQMELIGASGEQYNHEIHRGTTRVPPPQCRVVDRQGRVLAQGTLSYG
jgi:mannose-6-phosphate isomerase-like protein (cupin superfamily)